ncbi:hypothetical protein [Streptomyces albireticuli]|uniref:Uncharacterized protein n=1 Tax=Streptomyces albireticuli TaxID=1940 RepID=A0A2A2D166_9ACTN|nr:hypothetical protein [Streptomyces albireticuli]MCD9145709.1 hypothetical protein [Streptomyces albireticuli]MCD9165559.1 hypothetical protein [Streptomyces albireticuli]MCD9195918.1 hypothetical protein [Streptomyces albireticuli]PAU45159.1 hypothetical protein CK936_30835 [Streptomyces albireticuli]
MHAPRHVSRIVATAGAAVLMLVGGMATPSQAAEGTFFYTRGDTGAERVLGPTPDGQCLSIPGGARNAHNDTDTDARLYTNSSCTSTSRFLGSRQQSGEYSMPYPTYVKFG